MLIDEMINNAISMHKLMNNHNIEDSTNESKHRIQTKTLTRYLEIIKHAFGT